MYCQPVELDEIGSLANEIASHIEGSPHAVDLSRLVVGGFVLGQFTLDDFWYRGRVISVKTETAVIQFVDYGNEEELPPSRLLAIPPSLCSLPCQAAECVLEGLESYILAPKARETLGEIILNAECSLVCVSLRDDGLPVVRLTMEGNSVLNLALESGAVGKACAAMLSKPVARTDTAPPMKLTYSVDSLVPGSTIQAYVSHADSPVRFVCQLAGCESVLDNLMSSLQEQFSNLGPQPTFVPAPGDVVAALFEDGLWYRAEVLSVAETEKSVQVCYFDYGNSETVPFTSIHPWTGSLRQVPVQGIVCEAEAVVVAEKQQDPSSVVQEFLATVQDIQLTLSIASVREHVATVATITTDDGQDVYAQLIQKGFVEEKDAQVDPTSSHTQGINDVSNTAPTNTSGQPAVSQKEYRQYEIIANDTRSVFVSHIESETEFWVHPEVESLELLQLSEDMRQVYEIVADAAELEVSNPYRGMPVCAQFSEDLHWHRAKVKTVETDGGVEVIFVDFGNSEVVRPPLKIYHLKEEFLLLPALGIRCTPVPGSTVELNEDRATALLFESQNGSENVWKVRPAPVTGIEPPSPFRRPLTPPPVPTISKLDLRPGQHYPVYIPVTESPTEFWCQLASEAEKLEELMARLADYYTENRPQPILEKGTYCVAQFVENKSLYRARIVKVNSEQEVTVLFVDYGNQEVVDSQEVLSLDPQFATFPRQAFCCSLFSSDQVEFSGDRLEAFFSLPLDEEEFTVVFDRLLPSGKWLVQLFDPSGRCINDMLTSPSHSPSSSSLQLSQFSETYSIVKYPIAAEVDGYVTCIASPSSFYCQPLELAGELEDLMNRVSAYVTSLAQSQPPVEHSWLPGQACLGCYSIDGEWYRGLIEEYDSNADKYLVRYVDYGNSEFLAADQLLLLPTEFHSVPIQALLCSVIKEEWLGYEEQFEWPETSIEKFKMVVHEEEQVFLKIVSFSQSLQKYTVDVVIEGEALDFSHLQVECHQYAAASASKIHEIDEGELGDQFPGLHPREIADQSAVSTDIGELSTVALKGSKTPTTDMEESEGESAATGEPLIHAPFNLSLAQGENVDVVVVHVEDPSLIYVQRVDCASALESLAQEIDQYCQDFADKLVQFSYQPGDFVLAQCSLDKRWNRAQVKSVVGSQFEVQFIDYGNTEVISPDQMIMCSTNFLELPVQAISCSLSQVPSRESWPEEYKALLDNLILNKVVSVTVVVVGSHGMPPTLVMVDKETGVEVSHKVLERLQEECDAGAAIAGGNLLTDAYAIAELPEEEEEGEERELRISKELEKNGGEEKVAVEDEIESEEHDEERFQPVSSLAVQDLLSPGPVEGRKSTALIQSIGIYGAGGPEEDPTKICKFSELPLEELKKGMKYKVYVVDIVSPSDFSCQLACRSDTIEAMTSVMSQLYDQEENRYSLPSTPAVGDLVAARYDKDDNFYRSVVRGYLEHIQQFEVYFIDFGTSLTLPVDKLQRLDTRLACSAPLVLKCSLSGVPDTYHDPNRSAGGLVDKMLDLIGEEYMNVEIQSYTSVEGLYEVVLVNAAGVSVNDEVIQMIDAIEITYQNEMREQEVVHQVAGAAEKVVESVDREVSVEDKPTWSDELCTSHVPELQENEFSVHLLTSDSMDGVSRTDSGLVHTDSDPSMATVLSPKTMAQSPQSYDRTEAASGSDVEKMRPTSVSPGSDSGTVMSVSKSTQFASNVGPAVEVSVEDVTAIESPKDGSVSYPTYAEGDKLEVRVLRLSGVDNFTCQVIEGEETISAAIAEGEGSIAGGSEHLRVSMESLSHGEPVLARSSGSQTWLRAAVTKIDVASGMVQVCFVDRSGSEELTEEDLKPMDREIVGVSPPLVFDCQLPPLRDSDVDPSARFPGEEWELEWPEHCSRYFKEIVHDVSRMTVEILSPPLGTSKRYTVRLFGSLNESATSSDNSNGDVRAAVISKLKTPASLDLSEDEAESTSENEDHESFEEEQCATGSEEEYKEARGEQPEEGREQKVGTEVDGECTRIAGSETIPVDEVEAQTVSNDSEDDAIRDAPDLPTSLHELALGDQPAEEKTSVEVWDDPVKDPASPLDLGECDSAVFRFKQSCCNFNNVTAEEFQEMWRYVCNCY